MEKNRQMKLTFTHNSKDFKFIHHITDGRRLPGVERPLGCKLVRGERVETEAGYCRSSGCPLQGPGSDPERMGQATRHILPTLSAENRHKQKQKHTQIFDFLVAIHWMHLCKIPKQMNSLKQNWNENLPIHFLALSFTGFLAIQKVLCNGVPHISVLGPLHIFNHLHTLTYLQAKYFIKFQTSTHSS